AHSFTADPEAAAFVAEVRSPATDTKHRAVFVAANDDRARARNEQNAGVDADGADRSDECVTFDDDLRAGYQRLQRFLIKSHAIRPARPGESAAHNVRLFC